MTKSRICLIISSLIYGTIPVLTKMVYIYGGTNRMMAMLGRIFLIVPLLFFLFLEDKKRLILSFSELKQVIILGVAGIIIPSILFCLSYNYVNISVASTLHYTYPLIIAIASAFIYNENIKKSEIISSIVVTFGVFMFSDISARSNHIGIILAFLSGIFHSFYIMYMKYSDTQNIDFAKLSFYLCMLLLLVIPVAIYIIRGMDFVFFDLSLVCSVFIYSMMAVIALPLFQKGIKHENAVNAGIISMSAPLSSIIFNVIFFCEEINIFKILGFILIIIGIILLRYGPKYKKIIPQKSY